MRSPLFGIAFEYRAHKWLLAFWPGARDVTNLWSRDRGAPDASRRDFVFSRFDPTFNIGLPNGQYQVSLVVGDQNYMYEKMDIHAEGVMVSGLTLSAGTLAEVTFTVDDGQLNITFHDDGGADANWVINSMIVSCLE